MTKIGVEIKAWQMLWKLATNARFASPVNDIDLYDECTLPINKIHFFDSRSAVP